jgi:hypothetical protein
MQKKNIGLGAMKKALRNTSQKFFASKLLENVP